MTRTLTSIRYRRLQMFNLNTAASSNCSKRSTAPLRSSRSNRSGNENQKGSCSTIQEFWKDRKPSEFLVAEAGRKLDGGVLPLLMSIARIGSTETRRWR
jgi:hypothetical protein